MVEQRIPLRADLRDRRAVRRFITGEDVNIAVERGHATLLHDGNCTVTDEARDRAARLQITIIDGSRPAPSPAEAVRAKSSDDTRPTQRNGDVSVTDDAIVLAILSVLREMRQPAPDAGLVRRIAERVIASMAGLPAVPR